MGTHHRGKPDEVRALDSYIKLIRAADAVSTYVCKHLKQYQLTISQFGVLEALYYLGPMCQKTIAQKILKSTGNMTLVIDNLIKRGLVNRKQDPNDRRYVTITLTPKGRQLIQSIMPDHIQRIRKAFAPLTPEEHQTLDRLLKKVGYHCSELLNSS